MPPFCTHRHERNDGAAVWVGDDAAFLPELHPRHRPGVHLGNDKGHTLCHAECAAIVHNLQE
jgi:hypothetical protein